jgi:dolichol-phosphate mannosyltransferase
VPAKALELSVVVPTFQERENIHLFLKRLSAVLVGVAYEVIFVDDDSPDGTAEIIRAVASTQPNIRLIQRMNRRGLASACLDGMLSGSAPYLAVMAADLQQDERILPEMLRAIKVGNLDLVVGARHAGSDSALNSLCCKFKSLIGNRRITDPVSNYFIVRREFLEETRYRLSCVGSSLLLDLLTSAKLPPHVCEVKFTLRNRVYGESKLNLLTGLEYLQLVLARTVGNVIPPCFVLFTLMGLAGLATYFLVFSLALFAIPTSFDVAQITAAAAAMTVNFCLNNAFTFRSARLRGTKTILRGLLSFYAACSVGMWINLKMAHAAATLGSEWYSAGLFGLGAGSIWNYGVTKVFTWHAGRTQFTQRALQSNEPVPSFAVFSNEENPSLVALAAQLTSAEKV